jgi:hypothetical protein
MENILKISPMLVVAWYTPMAIGGCLLATLGGLIFHRVPGTVMMAITGVASIICSLLFAFLPEHPNYFAWIFPAMLCAVSVTQILILELD